MEELFPREAPSERKERVYRFTSSGNDFFSMEVFHSFGDGLIFTSWKETNGGKTVPLLGLWHKESIAASTVKPKRVVQRKTLRRHTTC